MDTDVQLSEKILNICPANKTTTKKIQKIERKIYIWIVA